MGYGEYIGGGSVHWRVVHEEYEESEPRRRSPEPEETDPPAAAREEAPGKEAARTFKPFSRRLARTRLRTANVPDDKPAEHIANLDVLDYEARGKDAITYDQIGHCNGSKDHKGNFRVIMRFQKLEDAQEAARRAQRIVERDGMYVLSVDVPVIVRDDRRVGPPPDPPAEVRVDW